MTEALEAKRDLRARVRALRAAVADERRREASGAVTRRALDLCEVSEARSVLAYAALAEEIDPAPLVASLRGRGARVAYPRVCEPGVMSLHWVGPEVELSTGTMGIPEPDERCAWASPADFDLVIVPGVAFDASCARLGFGGGFYDALLPLLPETAFTVALAFEEQMVGEVPCEPHDARVDAVVTPEATHVRSRGTRKP